MPKNNNHDYIPEVGRGILWDKADNAKEVDMLFKKIMSTLQTNRKQLKEEGKKIRSFCFSESKEELINLAFELN